MSKSFVVVGDAIIDEYQFLASNRISPEAPVLVAERVHQQRRAGGCLNVAINLSRLGNKVTVITQLGNDECANFWKSISDEEGIRNINLACDGYQTIHKQRLVASKQQLLRIDTEAVVEPQLTSDLVADCTKELKNADLVIVSDYAKGTVSEKIMELVRINSESFIVDPKNTDWSRYSGADIITPNRSELSAVIDKCNDFKDDQIQKLISRFSINSLLLTMSENGMKLYVDDKCPVHFNASANDIVDVTGAGDVVVAVVGHLLAQGFSREEATKFSNLIAGISVTTFGTHVTSLDELNRVMKPEEKIVFTNGCFDLLHAGHVDYLQKARAMGDRLVVGLNSDRSVARLKGKGRPVNSQVHRKFVLEALSCVDQVIIFEDETPLSLIKKVQPDVLVKGEDYSVENIVGAEFVKKMGGKVCTVPFNFDLSTSKTISSILDG